MLDEKTTKGKTNMELLEIVERQGRRITKLMKENIEQENLIDELLEGDKE